MFINPNTTALHASIYRYMLSIRRVRIMCDESTGALFGMRPDGSRCCVEVLTDGGVWRAWSPNAMPGAERMRDYLQDLAADDRVRLAGGGGN